MLASRNLMAVTDLKSCWDRNRGSGTPPLDHLTDLMHLAQNLRPDRIEIERRISCQH
jgi:hypothetical protein